MSDPPIEDEYLDPRAPSDRELVTDMGRIVEVDMLYEEGGEDGIIWPKSFKLGLRTPEEELSLFRTRPAVVADENVDDVDDDGSPFKSVADELDAEEEIDENEVDHGDVESEEEESEPEAAPPTKRSRTTESSRRRR